MKEIVTSHELPELTHHFNCRHSSVGHSTSTHRRWLDSCIAPTANNHDNSRPQTMVPFTRPWPNDEEERRYVFAGFWKKMKNTNCHLQLTPSQTQPHHCTLPLREYIAVTFTAYLPLSTIFEGYLCAYCSLSLNPKRLKTHEPLTLSRLPQFATNIFDSVTTNIRSSIENCRLPTLTTIIL